MRSNLSLYVALAFIFAATLSILSAMGAARVIEDYSLSAVQTEMDEAGFNWIHVETNGLQVLLRGTAPSEALQFRALKTANGIVDSARVINEMGVVAARAVAAPRFSIEILQNPDEISLIGLIPAATDRSAILAHYAEARPDAQIVDFLETADYPVPEGWEQAMLFGYQAVEVLEKSKISLAADRITVTAISNSRQDKARLDAALAEHLPHNIEVQIDISAPRPVITPFVLRFTLDQNGARMDACSADTDTARTKILAAGHAAGLSGETVCTLGLGVPSTTWGDAGQTAIGALATLGHGTLSIIDGDVTIVAHHSVPQELFDTTMGELGADLPELFSLNATLTPKPVTPTGDETVISTSFLATLSPEGQVQLRGFVPDQRSHDAVVSYGKARFGVEAIYAPLRQDPNLPPGWSLRVLATIEALATLNNGSAEVSADGVHIKGVTGNPDAKTQIAAQLANHLGATDGVNLAITYVEALDPVAALPTPQECVDGINAILTAQKITFAPGSDDIAAGGSKPLDQIASLMEGCQEVPMEIGGHTDSQGRESMNQNLSQGRAEAVISGLMARRILTENLTAKGYGESQPIADNDTEEGREANRRIEFQLIETDTTDNGQTDTKSEDQAEPAAAAPEPNTDEETQGE